MKKYDRLKYALPPVITAALLFIIYAIKHIFPFGSNTIDFYDLSNQIVTYYCHVFDVLHGEKNLFYDAYTAFGTNMVGTCGSSNISVFNLFFLFISRNSILKSMSVFLAIKMIVMSFTMFLFLDYVSKNKNTDMSITDRKRTNTFDVSYIFNLIFSVGYAFSGFVLTTYTIMQWQDIAAFLPLIMLGLYKLVKEGKNSQYIIFLTMSLIAGYYLSIMIIIFIFILVGFMVFTGWIGNRFNKENTENKKNNENNNNNNKGDNYHILNLFLSTLVSILMSAFILIPQILQTLNSSRFVNESGSGIIGTYMDLLMQVKPAYTSRWFVLSCLTLPIAIIVYSVLFRKSKKIIKYSVFTVVVLFTGFFIESINLIWCYGSYVHYPIRNGFIISFSVYTLASMCVQEFREDEEGLYRKISDQLLAVKPVKIVSIGVLVTAIIASLVIVYYSSRTGLVIRNVFHIFVALCAVFFALYFLILFFNKGLDKIRIKWIFPFVFMAEILLWSYVFLGPPSYTTGYTEEPEMENDYYYMCNQLYESFDELKTSDVFIRLKNPDLSLNSNYGLVIRNSVLSNWTALLPPRVQQDAKKLGYSIQYTRVLDGGGTIFSDSITGIKWIVSCFPQDEKLYKLVDTAKIVTDQKTGKEDIYYLYENRFVMPYGFVCDTVDIDFEGLDEVELSNRIYQCISGENDNIADWINISDDIDNNECKAKINVNGRKALYYFSNQVDSDDYNTKLYVNGSLVGVPSVKEMDNELYPAHFNNNALFLGTFNDEDVELDITFLQNDKKGNNVEHSFEPRIMAIDIEKLESMSKEYKDLITERRFDKSKYTFNVSESGLENGYLILPISYDKGYSAKVNGNKEEVISVGGLFSAVKLSGGDNVVSISFLPDGMKTGILISLVAFVSLILLTFLDKKLQIINKRVKWIESIYSLAFVATMLVMYAIPIIYAVISIGK